MLGFLSQSPAMRLGHLRTPLGLFSRHLEWNITNSLLSFYHTHFILGSVLLIYDFYQGSCSSQALSRDSDFILFASRAVNEVLGEYVYAPGKSKQWGKQRPPSTRS